MKKILSVAVFGVLAAASSANAAPITFTNAGAFSTAAGVAGIALSTETFNAVAIQNLPVSVGNLTVSDTNPVAGSVGEVDTAIFGSGRSVQDTTNAGLLERFTFGSAINAFGVDLFDLGTVGATTLAYQLSNGASGNLFINYSGGGQLFAGVIDSNPFTWIQINNSVNGDFVEFDNVQSGVSGAAAVPEPASLTLLGLGLAGAAARRRRSRKNQ